ILTRSNAEMSCRLDDEMQATIFRGDQVGDDRARHRRTVAQRNEHVRIEHRGPPRARAKKQLHGMTVVVGTIGGPVYGPRLQLCQWCQWCLLGALVARLLA